MRNRINIQQIGGYSGPDFLNNRHANFGGMLEYGSPGRGSSFQGRDAPGSEYQLHGEKAGRVRDVHHGMSRQEVARFYMQKNLIIRDKGTNNMKQLTQTIEAIGVAFEGFREINDQKLDKLQNHIESVDKVVAEMKTPPGGGISRADGFSLPHANEHHDKFLAWARKGLDPDGLRKIEASLSTLSDPDGGYLVPIIIEKNIERLAQSAVAMRRLARIVPSKGEYTKPLSKGGATGGWVAEKESRTETDTPTLTLFSPKMCEIYAQPVITQKLLDMSDFDIAGWLSEEIFDTFTTREGLAFITGDGVSKPHGIIDESLMIANASWTYGKTGFITSGHASLLNNADKLVSLQHALKPVYRQNATWLMSDSTFESIRKLKDGEGNYLWRPGLEAGQPDTLLGKPLELDDNMPNVDVDGYPVAYGDFKRAYTIVDHVSGTRLLRDPYTTKGSVAFYTTKRVAAGISNYEALKFMKISA